MVPSKCRKGKMSDRRYLVANRDRRHSHYPLPGYSVEAVFCNLSVFRGQAHPFGCSIRRGNQGQRGKESLPFKSHGPGRCVRFTETISASRIPISNSTRDIISRVTGAAGTRMVTIDHRPGRRESTLRHRMGTAEVESALVAHESVAEAAVVGFPHEVKGEGIGAEHPERRRVFRGLEGRLLEARGSERSSDPSLTPTSSTGLQPFPRLGPARSCGGFA